MNWELIVSCMILGMSLIAFILWRIGAFKDDNSV